jgi:hypothetical protein
MGFNKRKMEDRRRQAAEQDFFGSPGRIRTSDQPVNSVFSRNSPRRLAIRLRARSNARASLSFAS